MVLRQLRYFVTVVEEETVTAAAQKLNMTQPPLTAQLQLLEKELGCSLFYRKGRRLQLTEAGKHFYQRANVILGMCDSALAEMRDFDKGTAGTLRIGVVSSIQENVFIQWITAFSSLYPDIRYEIYDANTYQLLDQVCTGQLDIAVVRTPFSAPNIRKRILREETLMAVGEKRYFQSGTPEVISLEELYEKPLIVYRRWEQIIRTSFEEKGLFPTIKCCNDTAYATLALASAGMGIGILPASAVSQVDKNNLKICALQDPHLISHIAMICRNGESLSQTARLFWEFMEFRP